jgi:sensor histidine kinase YesM
MNAPKQLVKIVTIFLYDYKQLTLRKGHCPAVNINQTIIPQAEVLQYLWTALRLQVELERTHRQNKRKQIYLKTKEIKWLIGTKDPIYL